eukprot:3911211-Amphidinium_carterae.4
MSDLTRLGFGIQPHRAVQANTDVIWLPRTTASLPEAHKAAAELLEGFAPTHHIEDPEGFSWTWSTASALFARSHQGKISDTPATVQETTPQGELITFRPYQELPPPDEQQALISHRLPWAISDAHARTLTWSPVSGHRNLCWWNSIVTISASRGITLQWSAEELKRVVINYGKENASTIATSHYANPRLAACIVQELAALAVVATAMFLGMSMVVFDSALKAIWSFQLVETGTPLHDPRRTFWQPRKFLYTTSNVGGWGTGCEQVKAWSADSDNPDVIFLQEHRLLLDALPAASGAMKAAGYKSCWTPAVATDKFSTSCGTGILVRPSFPLHQIDGPTHPSLQGRVTAAVLQAGLKPGILCVSIYLMVQASLAAKRTQLGAL